MARPGIAAAAIFLFFHSWNDYYGPLLYTSENQAWWPVAYGLATFRGQSRHHWGLTMAMTMLVWSRSCSSSSSPNACSSRASR